MGHVQRNSSVDIFENNSSYKCGEKELCLSLEKLQTCTREKYFAKPF